MTTPRIEEMVAKILEDLPRYAMTREDKMWGLKKLSFGAYADISDLDEILTEALTETHQAGIDVGKTQALHLLEDLFSKAKDKAELIEMFNDALQDNK